MLEQVGISCSMSRADLPADTPLPQCFNPHCVGARRKYSWNDTVASPL